ncbi:hypothetical protein C8P68_106219 [Mucilaginibacter yixingensis]|uniref:Uncharacterized protein n=1 Tax=Mucilaginibacter yixingensis TaxID=1295612 RepID=A0A2T5J779_9SPHI|nr:hypothetical protein [Mucilaginibacter yixingensis]PTQ95004.1 hypothetical protein C8P68_106219 [Mucilaginibacter yixingensis]
MGEHNKQLNNGKNHSADAHHSNLDVMKPFLKFGVGAMSAIGHTLVSIVKSVPRPHGHQDEDNQGRVIKL